MKTLRLFLSLLVMVSALHAAQAIKDLTLAGTNAFGGTVNNTATNLFLSGSSATFATNSTLTVNGTFTGTPAAGALNLAALTLTLPPTVSGGSSFLSRANHTGSQLAATISDFSAAARAAAPDVTAKPEDEATAINIVLEGDSLQLGGYATTLGTLSYAAGRATIVNVATSGYVLAQIDSRYSTLVRPYRPAVTGKPAWLLLQIGSNDAYAGNDPVAWATTWLAYIDRARADGFKVCVFSIMRRVGILEPDDWRRMAINTTIRTNSSHYDVLIDLANLIDASSSNSGFQNDGTHLNTDGNNYVARLVNYALARPIFAGPNENGFTKPMGKLVINGGASGGTLIVSETVGSSAYLAFYKPSGVGTEYWGTRLYYNGTTSGLSVQVSTSAAFGSQSWTNALSFDAAGAATFAATLGLPAAVATQKLEVNGGGTTNDVTRLVYDASARLKLEFYRWTGSGTTFWAQRIGVGAPGQFVIECAAAGANIGSHTFAEWIVIDGFNGNVVLKKPLRFESFAELKEMTAPGAPAADTARVYAEDNGSGKTRVVVRFPTGAVQVLATEP